MMRAVRRVVYLMPLLAALACAHVTTVPPSRYRGPEHGLSYRVHRTNGVTYYVADFTANDSTLIIETFRRVDRDNQPTPPTPFLIPLSEVESVESLSVSDKAPLLLAGIILLVVGLGIAAGVAGVGAHY
jgi:hypothetical protein